MTKAKFNARIALIVLALVLALTAVFALVRINASADGEITSDTIKVYIGKENVALTASNANGARTAEVHLADPYTDPAVKMIKDYFAGSLNVKPQAGLGKAARSAEIILEGDAGTIYRALDQATVDTLVTTASAASTGLIDLISRQARISISEIKVRPAVTPATVADNPIIYFSQVNSGIASGTTYLNAQSSATTVKQNYNFEHVTLTPERINNVTNSNNCLLYAATGNNMCVIGIGGGFPDNDDLNLTFGQGSRICRDPDATKGMILVTSSKTYDSNVTKTNKKVTVNIEDGIFEEIYYANYDYRNNQNATPKTTTTDTSNGVEINISGGTINKLAASNGVASMKAAKATINISGGTITNFATLGMLGKTANSGLTYVNTASAQETVDFDINITGGTITNLYGTGYKNQNSTYTLNGSVDYYIGKNATIGNSFKSLTAEATKATMAARFVPINGNSKPNFICNADVTVHYDQWTFPYGYPGIAVNGTIKGGHTYKNILTNCTVTGSFAGACLVGEFTGTASGSGAAEKQPLIYNDLSNTNISGVYNGCSTGYSRNSCCENHLKNVNVGGVFSGVGGSASVSQTSAGGYVINDIEGGVFGGIFNGVGTSGKAYSYMKSTIKGATFNSTYRGIGQTGEAQGKGVPAGTNVVDITLEGCTFGFTYYGIGEQANICLQYNSAKEGEESLTKSAGAPVSITVKDSSMARYVHGLNNATTKGVGKVAGQDANGVIFPLGGGSIDLTYDNVTFSGNYSRHFFVTPGSNIITLGAADKPLTDVKLTFKNMKFDADFVPFKTVSNLRANVTVETDSVEVDGSFVPLGSTIIGDLTTNLNNMTVKGKVFSAGTGIQHTGKVFATVNNCVAMQHFEGINGYEKTLFKNASTAKTATLTINDLTVHGGFYGVGFLGNINNTGAEDVAFTAEYNDLKLVDRFTELVALNKTDTDADALGYVESYLSIRSNSILKGGVDVTLNSGCFVDSEGNFADKLFVYLLGTSGSKVGGENSHKPSVFNINGGEWPEIRLTGYAAEGSTFYLYGDATVNVNGGKLNKLVSPYTQAQFDSKERCQAENITFNYNLDKANITLSASQEDFSDKDYVEVNLNAGDYALYYTINTVKMYADKVVIPDGKTLKFGLTSGTSLGLGNTFIYAKEVVDGDGQALDFTQKYTNVSDRVSSVTLEAVKQDVTNYWLLKCSQNADVVGTTLVLGKQVKVRFIFGAGLIDTYYGIDDAPKFMLGAKELEKTDFIYGGKRDGVTGSEYYYVDSDPIAPADYGETISLFVASRDYDYEVTVNGLLKEVADDGFYAEDFKNLCKALYNYGILVNKEFNDGADLPTYEDLASATSSVLHTKNNDGDVQFAGASLNLNDELSINIYAKVEGDALANLSTTNDNIKVWVNDCNKNAKGEYFKFDYLATPVNIGDVECNAVFTFTINPQYFAEQLTIEAQFGEEGAISNYVDSGVNIANALIAADSNVEPLQALLTYIKAAQIMWPVAAN